MEEKEEERRGKGGNVWEEKGEISEEEEKKVRSEEKDGRRERIEEEKIGSDVRGDGREGET